MVPAPTPPPLGDIAALCMPVVPLRPDMTIDTAAERLLAPENAGLLCLPVVIGEVVVGTLSRHTLNGVFLRRFGRELYGSRPVTALMNEQPLIVPLDLPLEQAAADVTARIGSPLTEDFVIVDGNRYQGMGVVLDLLAALRARADQSAAQLASAFVDLKQSQAALVQSENMASLGQMVAGVAHEINTPLGYVRNNVEMVRDVFTELSEAARQMHHLVELFADPEADEARLTTQIQTVTTQVGALGDGVLDDTRSLFEDTLFGVDQIRDLVVNLRNFSRLDQARVAQISLNDCLDQTLMIANNVIKDCLAVVKRYGDVPAVSCSPSQINQVLLNLVTNAAQAVPDSGGKLLLKTEADGDWVHVSVQDNGKGIAPEHLAKIFDPFFTTKPVGQGTGLGLSISFQIVEAHGGRLQVASKPGIGTRFVLSLPLRAHGAEPEPVESLAA